MFRNICGTLLASNSRRRMGLRLATERDAGREGAQAGVPKHSSVVVQGKQFGSQEIRLKVDSEEAPLGQDGAGLAGFEEIVEESTGGQWNVHSVQQSKCSQNDSSRKLLRDHDTMKRLQQARQAMIGADSQGRARKSSMPSLFKSTKVANMIERMATGAAEADDSMQVTISHSPKTLILHGLALIWGCPQCQVAFLATENSTVQRKSHLLPAYLTRPWADTRSNWRKTMGGHLINKHEQLFWLEKNGEWSLLHAGVLSWITARAFVSVHSFTHLYVHACVRHIRPKGCYAFDPTPSPWSHHHHDRFNSRISRHAFVRRGRWERQPRLNGFR